MQLQGRALLAHDAAAQLPAPRAARVGDLERPRRDPREHVLQPQVARAPSDQAVGALAEEPLSRAIHEPQRPLRIEREHRHGDLFEHFAERLRGLHRAESLVSEDLLERVHLEVGEGERVRRLAHAGANREVPLPERREHVGERPEWPHDVLAQHHGEAEPGPEQEDRDQPLHAHREVAEPDQRQRGGDPGQARQHRQHEDAAVVPQALPRVGHGAATRCPGAGGVGRARSG